MTSSTATLIALSWTSIMLTMTLAIHIMTWWRGR